LFAAPRFGSCGAISVIAVMLLSSIGTADAWSRAMARHPPKHHGPKLAALTPEPFIRELAAKHSPSNSVAGCTPAKFRIVLDVGHTAESEGAISARNVAEFVFNLHLAQRIVEKLKADGFTETRLLVTEGKAKPSLFKRVAAANDLGANLFLSIHHDSVPDNMLEAWDFNGKKSHFSDRFSGYSVWVSRDNPQFRTSLSFAELIGKQHDIMKLHVEISGIAACFDRERAAGGGPESAGGRAHRRVLAARSGGVTQWPRQARRPRAPSTRAPRRPASTTRRR